MALPVLAEHAGPCPDPITAHAIRRYQARVTPARWKDARASLLDLMARESARVTYPNGRTRSLSVVNGRDLCLVYSASGTLVTVYWRDTEKEDDMEASIAFQETPTRGRALGDPQATFSPKTPYGIYLNATATAILGNPKAVDITQVNDATLLITPGKEFRVFYASGERGGANISVGRLYSAGTIPQVRSIVKVHLSRGNGHSLYLHPKRIPGSFADPLDILTLPAQVAAPDEQPAAQNPGDHPAPEMLPVKVMPIPEPTRTPVRAGSDDAMVPVAERIRAVTAELRGRDSLLLPAEQRTEIRAAFDALKDQIDRWEFACAAIDEYLAGDQRQG